ncbi:MAG: hypothetical protein FWD34_05565 [Oscillospiraceae bacterium]|nr:hypothetical protein [Oscillospiraceae bacterium]
MKKNRDKRVGRGSFSIKTNFFLITAIIVGLSAYFTVNSLWSAGTIVVIILLTIVASFYFWLWRVYFK